MGVFPSLCSLGKIIRERGREKTMFYWKNFAVLAAGILFMSSGQAMAQVRSENITVCNEARPIKNAFTSGVAVQSRYTVAVAYYDSVRGSWMSKGWWNINSLSCAKIGLPKKRSRNVYIYARLRYYFPRNANLNDSKKLMAAMALAKEEADLKGNYSFCVKQESFNIKGERRCASRGYLKQGFHEVVIPVGSNTLIELFPRARISVGPA